MSPTLVSHSGFLGPHGFTLLPLVSPLSLPLGALGRMSLHLSPTCLPHLSPTLVWVPWAAWVYTCLPLVSHSGCLGPHEFTLVSQLSPTPVFHTCLPLWVPWVALSPTLRALGRMSLHLSPPCLPLVSHTCLPLWVSWAA